MFKSRPALLFFRFFMIFSLILISANFSYAVKSQEIDAEGYAVIVDGRKDSAREMALQNAFRRAVEQAVGVMVQSETMVKNFELLNDKVYSRSTGYINKYTITGEKIVGDEFRVKINARVSAVKLRKDLDDIGLIIKKVGKPRLMLLISEQNIMSDKPASWWADGTSGVGVSENTMLARFMEKGFNMVDRQAVMRALKDDPSLSKNLSSSLSNDVALKLAAEGEAEVVIIGQAVAKSGSGLAGTSIRSCQATISARALNADSGEPLASLTTNGVVAHIDQVTGGSEALKKASLEMTDKMIGQIIAKWKKKAGGEHKVKLIIKGLSFDKVKGFKEFLKTAIEGLDEIYDRGYRDNIAKLDLEAGENAKEIAESLSEKKYRDGIIEISSITSNIIEITVRKK